MPKFVLSCDVAKGKSTFGLFEFEDGSLKTIKRPRNYEHNLDGLMAMYNDFELKDREDVLVMMESTLVYQTPLVVFFKSHGLENVVVENPLLIARKSFGLTKTKTDNLDCFRIADYAFRQQWEKPVQVSKEQQEARTLSRYIDSLLSQATVVQNKIRLYLVSVFPKIEKIAGKSLFSAGFLNLLKTCPHPQTISRKTIDGIVTAMAGNTKRCASYQELARKIKEVSKTSLSSVKEDSAECLILVDIVSFYQSLSDRIRTMRQKLSELVRNHSLYSVLTSFKGIGDGIASSLTAELWDIEKYSNDKKLFASTGMAPGKEESGASINKDLSIGKKGNAHVRKWLFVAVQSIITQASMGRGDERIYAYYEKKHNNDKKHYYAAVVACCHKLLKQVYHRYMVLLKTNELIVY